MQFKNALFPNVCKFNGKDKDVIGQFSNELLPIDTKCKACVKSIDINDDVIVSDVINYFMNEYQSLKEYDMRLIVVKDGTIRFTKKFSSKS